MSEETSNTATPAASGDTAPAVLDSQVTANTESHESEVVADAASDPAQPKEPKKVDPRQKKIAELSYQTREQQRRIDQLIGMMEKTISQPRQAEGKAAPKIEDFQTLDAYLEARDEYRDKAKSSKDTQGKDQPDVQYHQAVTRARESLMEAGSEKYDDFEEVVTSDNIRITPVMRDAIFELDDQEIQAELTYYLGKNPKEAQRIAKLSPMRQIAEVGKLEAKLTSTSTPTKRPSSAPDPIKPVGGAVTKTNKLTVEDSVAEHIKKRRAGVKFSP